MSRARGVAAAALAALAAVPAPAADPAPSAVELRDGWRARSDPSLAGRKGRWDGISLDDRGWAVAALEGPIQGTPRWWRRWVPATGWERTALVLEGVTGRVTVFVQGGVLADDLAARRLSDGRAVVDLTDAVRGKERFLIALLARPEPGRPAGVTGARLVSDPLALARVPADQIALLAGAFPDLPWPPWARGDRAAWIRVGDPDGRVAADVGWCGEVAPAGASFAVGCWLRDPRARRLHFARAGNGWFRLAGGGAPLSSVRFKAGPDFAVTLRLWPVPRSGGGAPPVLVAEAEVENLADRPREADLIVAVHPFGPRPAPFRIGRAAWDRDRRLLLADGRPAVLLPGAPEAAGAGAFGRDWAPVRRLAADGEPPAAVEAEDPDGLATAVAVYRCSLHPFARRVQSFRIFTARAASPGEPGSGVPDEAALDALRRLDRRASWAEAAAAWGARISGDLRPYFQVPDRRVRESFPAAAGHLVLAAALDPAVAADPQVAAALAVAGATGVSATVPLGPLPPPAPPDPPPPPGLSAASDFAAAHRRLLEGRPDEAWALAEPWLGREAVPGAWSWARIDPETGRPELGAAMPDPQAAAAWLRLVRDMLVREDAGGLLLAAGVPDAWARPGTPVRAFRVPTAFGLEPGYELVVEPARLRVARARTEPAERDVRRRRRGPARVPEAFAGRPPAGYRLRIPGTWKIRSVSVGGTPLKTIPPDRVISLPPDWTYVIVGR